MALSPPPYSDIFKYLDAGSVGAQDQNTGWVKSNQGPITGYHTEQQGGGEGGSVDVQVPDYATNYTIDTSQIPDKYKGLVQGYRSGVGGSSPDTQFDLSKLPNQGKTKFGDINQMTSLGYDRVNGPTMYMKSGGRKEDDEAVQDPSKVTWDDNYGWITNKFNIIKPHPDNGGWIDKVGNIAMMAGMAAMGMPELGGSLAGGLAASAFGGVKNYGMTGDWKKSLIGMAPGLVGAGLGMSGISMPSLPPELASALKYAQYAKQGYGAYKMIRGG